MRLRRLATVVPAVALMLAPLAGCGGADPDPVAASPSASPSPTPSPSDQSPSAESPSADDAVVVAVTFADGQVSPNGERVRVDVGETVQLDITADQPGELHVHSSPEQEIAYKKGSGSYELTIDRPGLVDVESHDLGVVVIQLQVG